MTQLSISLDDLTVQCRPQRLLKVRSDRSRLLFRTAGANAEVTAVGDGIVHVVWHPGDDWANDPTHHVTTTSRRRGVTWKLNRKDSTAQAASASLQYTRAPLRLRFADQQGTFLSESVKHPLGYSARGAALTWETSKDERIYGLGQNALASLNRVGQIRTMAADHAGGAGGDVPIAFWVSTRGYGVVVDNPNIASFDLRRRGQVSFSARDGYLNYFVLWGPTIADVLRRYVELTGCPPVPPRWFLGPLFSRIPGGKVPGYRTDRELVATGRKLRVRRIPADGLFLDYQWDEWIGAFRWSPKRFARARWMLDELDRLGLRTIVQLKPAVNIPARTATGLQSDGLVLARTDGTPHTGNFHRGRSVFLDFFKEDARQWYVAQLKRLTDDGVAGWWTDEGDWIGYLSQSIRDLARSPDTMRNRYNDAWCQTIHEGQRRHGQQRVVNLTRGACVGTQRYGISIWSGDVNATWEGLAAQLQMGLNMGLSGVPFWTTDGGGFLGQPSPELYVRWAQFATFSPLTRFHGCGPREPWHFGARAEQAVCSILRWRMRLMPYVYATAWQAHLSGLPMMRAMALVNERDKRFANLSSQYYFGDSLLVRPITEPLARHREGDGRPQIVLPAGLWYDFWTGHRLRAAKRLACSAQLDRIPVLVQAPAVVVLAEASDNTRDQRWDHLTARVYTGDSESPWQATCHLYEDDSTTYACEEGELLTTRLTARRKSSGSFTLTLAPSGRRHRSVPTRRRWRLEIYGLDSQPVVRVGTEAHTSKREGSCWAAELPPTGTTRPWAVTVAWQSGTR